MDAGRGIDRMEECADVGTGSTCRYGYALGIINERYRAVIGRIEAVIGLVRVVHAMCR
jgi:hypothetical protein